MKLIVAVNTLGTSTWMGYFHDRDWAVQKYQDEVCDAIKQTFRFIKEIEPITITEIDDVRPQKGQTKQVPEKAGYALKRGHEEGLAEREELIRTVGNAYKPGDKRVQEDSPESEEED